MNAWWLLPFVIGVNFTIWGIVGLFRVADEGVSRRRPPPRQRVRTADVGVLIAAHNEQLVIGSTLASLARLIRRGNIHVVSDGSTDDTVALARAAGVHVVETPTNLGKASALRFGIEHFSMLGRFRAVMVLDADTQLDRDYFRVALPLFDDPRVAAVAGCAHTRWQRQLGLFGNVVVAHRQRIYVLTQLLLKYGQTWRGISATHIVPGFASIYRTRALRHIDINPPGLVIEDFNMTFEVHAKRLGRVAFHPDARAYTQDPAHYRDYVRQTRRWALGLWQTIRRTRPGRATFAGALALMLLELVTSSVLFLLLPLLIISLAVVALVPGAATVPYLGDLPSVVSFRDLALGVALPDYLLTCAVAVLERRARFLLTGLLSLPMRVTDAAVALYALPRAWLDRSTGRWVSPTRRATPEPDGMEVA